MMTGGIFRLVAHVEAIERAMCIGLERGHLARAEMPDAGAIGDVARIVHGALEQADAAAARRAVFEVMPGERPAHRAVAQRAHLVGQARIDQGLRADDRTRAAGAVDDDGGVRIGRGVACAQHQLRAGHAERARNIHGRIFIETADIEDGDVGLALDQRSDLIRAERGRMAARLDQFAERLGVGVDVLEDFVAGVAPGLKPAASARTSL